MPDDKIEREEKLEGLGASKLRKEDARFIRGQGSYVDDIKLPGMLFGAMVRSPYAHARIKSIDKSKALQVPGVVAVLTADDLKPVKLHWMPTLGGDVLFREGIGRSDFPDGSHDQLVDSIRNKLFTLPDDTLVLPGHGPMTTIGHEKQFNPFVGRNV